MDEPFVEIRNLSKFFGKKNQIIALKEINARIPKGKMVGMAGPDGAGKTTLLRLISGLFMPSEGQIAVSGYDSIKGAEHVHNMIGYMPQKFGLYEDLTVQQNLTLYADLRGVLGKERSRVFDKLLTFTGLTPFTARLAGALSGGMKQKLGLACTLIKKPSLLLLDEPSVGVDPVSRRELWKMVHQLIDEGISVIWSTAYLDEAERCDSVILLSEGKMLFSGPPKDLTQRVKGRTFKLQNIEGSRRALLTKVLKLPQVIDATIQGSEIRVVTNTADISGIDLSTLQAGGFLQINHSPPRFEDAFLDILGGGPGGDSELAKVTLEVKAQRDIVIEAKGLTKLFGTFTAADDITLSVKRGEIFGLLGPNGAGKTTTFKMMCGLLAPTSGKAFVNGLDLQVAPSEARAQIGYMAQKFSLYGDLSVKQNLEFFSGIYNLRGSQKRSAVDKMIQAFDFKPYLDESAESLPLGFKQRLALSCAVIHHPEVIFLDEPTSGVDPITRREFWNHINGLVEKGVTVMVTTHFMDEAEYCDRIGLVYQSKMINIGTPDSLKELAKSAGIPSPTLEDAFIYLIERHARRNNE